MSTCCRAICGPQRCYWRRDCGNLRQRRVLASIHRTPAAGSWLWSQLGNVNLPATSPMSKDSTSLGVRTIVIACLVLLGCCIVEAVPTTPSSQPSTPVSTQSAKTVDQTLLPTETPDPLRLAVRESGILAEDGDFYTCPPPTGSTVVRIEPPRSCPKFDLGRNFTEGIAVIFKENIAPYKFRANVYYKDIVVTKVWKGYSHTSLSDRYNDRVPVSVEEIFTLIDSKGKCSSKAEYLRDNIMHHAYHDDEDEVELDLVPSKFATPGARAWQTTNDTTSYVGWMPWRHYTSTSVNCIVEEVEARSVYPYDSFALSTGDIVYTSPFYGLRSAAQLEHNSYAQERFRQVEGYQPRDLDSKLQAGEPVTKNFITTPHVTVSWNWTEKKIEACTLTKWKEVDELVRDEFRGSYRFTIRSISSTFISNTTQFKLEDAPLTDCVSKEAKDAIDSIYRKQYESTHVFSGDVEFYLARGGFLIAFRPMISNELARLYLNELVRSNRTYDLKNLLNPNANHNTNRTRRSLLSIPEPTPTQESLHREQILHRLHKRAVEAANSTNSSNVTAKQLELIKTTSSIEFAMLQFAYDHIQSHVNEMLSRIATAWCTLQNKERTLWNEMVKVNPSAIVSATLDERVAARVLGDVIAITHCVKIEGNVYLQNSMRSSDSNTCYSRPPVTFTITKNANSRGTIEGQLGEENEVYTERKLIEPCAINQKRYFKFGKEYVYYENYTYVRKVPPTEIEVISTYVELNLTLLEDREFLPLEVYTRAELEDTGLLDYSEIQRRNQLHALRFYDIDSVVNVDNTAVIMQGIATFFKGLGKVGEAVGTLVLGAAGAVVSTVSGIASFINNPFGGLAIGLLVIAGLVAAFFAYRYVMQLRSNPMKALYPITTRSLKNKAKASYGQNDDDDTSDFDEAKLEEAREMIKYMSMVSALEKQEKKAMKKNKGVGLIASNVSKLALRRRGPKYTRLREDDPMESEKMV
uniref:Envelope glycoprotein B n=1 Tax=Equid alphaherpesvirus 4 TaxID=10331 RepID=A0A109QI04_9ALPH|nr:envelope glycoprotein B [Equid alphaherpesvirus 4]AMB16553.1 envelope glycoprotein B [Equid alphaherpesvirus 4]